MKYLVTRLDPIHSARTASGHAITAGQTIQTIADAINAMPATIKSPDSLRPSTRRFVIAAPTELASRIAPAAARPELPPRARG